MTINIGSTIAQLRRKKGITQEQLAGALGISAPAVSKWETGQSYPDITMLPPLARFFRTSVDALLAYIPELSDADLDTLTQRLRDTFEKDGWAAGLAACDEALLEYPGNLRLRLLLASVLELCAVLPRITTPGRRGEAGRSCGWSPLRKMAAEKTVLWPGKSSAPFI